MKFLHTGDWHIGKKLNGFDLLEEQLFAFESMLELAESEMVDGIIIAGDLYDRSVPSVEAVDALNQMMIKMNLDKKFPVFAISGNHDSSTRLETGGPWFEHTNFHLHTRLEQAFNPVEFGDVQLFLLPYFEPFHARQYFEDDSIRSIDTAMEFVVEEMKKKVNPEKKQLLVAHFFVAGSSTTDSETKITVGGLDVVPLSLLGDFDYVALGHLHSKNALQGENARYSGSLLKYSVSEVSQKKGVWLVDVTENSVNYEFREIPFLRDLQVLTGSFETLMSPKFYKGQERDNYLAISLTDRGVIPNVMSQLRQIYPRIIQLERAYGRERETLSSQSVKKLTSLNPEELMTNYFLETTGDEMTDQQKNWLKEELHKSVITEGE